MTVDVYAADEQTEQPVDVDRWVSLARSVLRDRGVRGDAEVSLLFVDETSIADLNRRFLGEDRPTDVLAFPIEDDPAGEGDPPERRASSRPDGPVPPLTLLGDVVICPAVAAQNAAEHGVRYEDEVALLVVHGLLHLLGMDHEADADAEAMERLERKLLGKYHRDEPGRPKAVRSTGPGGGSDTRVPE